MIDYDPYHWTSHLLDLEGSMVREILGRVSLCAVWSVGVVAAHYTIGTIHVSPVTHTLVGVAMGMLLVFRTNASYDRFWEGRRMWGSIINESRNLARASKAFIAPAAPDVAERVVLWTSAFANAAMNNLREGSGTGAVARRLPEAEVRAVEGATHVPLAAAARISATLAEARDRGVISDIQLAAIDQNPQQLIDYVGACERIHKTPLPFVYVVHLRRALFLYCYTLPFALVWDYGWWTVLVVFLVTYTFFGIEEIGVEIENPFGLDANDLPLTRFCEVIDRDVLDALGLPPLRPPAGNDTVILDARPPLTAGLLPSASALLDSPVAKPRN